jgi:hypothetical protein
MDTEELIKIKSKIENMEKKNHLQILQIFKKNSKITLNENNNGTFINMNELDKNIIFELEKYIKYIDAQRQILDKDEKEKNTLENKYFK